MIGVARVEFVEGTRELVVVTQFVLALLVGAVLGLRGVATLGGAHRLRARAIGLGEG
jgi:hypothetical protein